MKVLNDLLIELGHAQINTGNDRAHLHVHREEFSLLATTLVNKEQLPLSLLFATDDRSINATFGIHVLFSFSCRCFA